MLLPKLREEVLEANLELVRRGLVLYTFGNSSGVSREETNPGSKRGKHSQTALSAKHSQCNRGLLSNFHARKDSIRSSAWQRRHSRVSRFPHTMPALDRNIFGSFLELLDRAIHEGIYDPGSKLADSNGFRTDIAAKSSISACPSCAIPGKLCLWL
jgi:hypothetical protein